MANEDFYEERNSVVPRDLVPEGRQFSVYAGDNITSRKTRLPGDDKGGGAASWFEVG